ncbi:MAG: DNA repair protein RecN [Firmicutes bacterium]|nr:DNA repair protein RecN [Bacillota bacterium]
MINRLIIKNFVLIEAAELDFCGKLNVLSGETGAGKSILVDAVMLLLGARYDKNFLRYGAENGFVEAFFSINKHSRKKLENAEFLDLDSYGIDQEILISRKFYNDGKNEIRINGKQITLNMLKQFTPMLIDIYGQHDYIEYLDPQAQLRLVDFFAGEKLNSFIKNCQNEYKKYTLINKELKELGQEGEREKIIDFLSYQINEIETVKLKENEEEDLIAKRKILLNSEKISSLINQSADSLSNSELNNAYSTLKKLQEYSPDFTDYSNRLKSLIIEADDILSSISKLSDYFSFEKDDLDKLEDRLLLVRNIKKKYGDYTDCQKYLSDATHKLNRLKNASDEYDKLLKQKQTIIANLYKISSTISGIRRNEAAILSDKIVSELKQLGMDKARFIVSFKEFPNLENCEKCLSNNGFDDIEFLFSANLGQPLKPFSKVASGGEMSRFMLAIKVVSGNFLGIDTLIFDEIDQGISGKVGQEVAKKLAEISHSSQVLCVTHLSQIASMADTHFFIDKINNNDTTYTKIQLLDQNGQINEISRLLGSIGISNTSCQTAIDMKEWSKKFKTTIKN